MLHIRDIGKYPPQQGQNTSGSLMASSRFREFSLLPTWSNRTACFRLSVLTAHPVSEVLQSLFLSSDWQMLSLKDFAHPTPRKDLRCSVFLKDCRNLSLYRMVDALSLWKMIYLYTDGSQNLYPPNSFRRSVSLRDQDTLPISNTHIYTHYSLFVPSTPPLVSLTPDNLQLYCSLASCAVNRLNISDPTADVWSKPSPDPVTTSLIFTRSHVGHSIPKLVKLVIIIILSYHPAWQNFLPKSFSGMPGHHEQNQFSPLQFHNHCWSHFKLEMIWNPLRKCAGAVS